MLLNDMARCIGEKPAHFMNYGVCTRRHECARYTERNSGGPRTMMYAYLCDDGDMYIPVKKEWKNY